MGEPKAFPTPEHFRFGRACTMCGEEPRNEDPGTSEGVCFYCGYFNVPPGPQREVLRQRRRDRTLDARSALQAAFASVKSRRLREEQACGVDEHDALLHERDALRDVLNDLLEERGFDEVLELLAEAKHHLKVAYTAGGYSGRAFLTEKLLGLLGRLASPRIAALLDAAEQRRAKKKEEHTDG